MSCAEESGLSLLNVFTGSQEAKALLIPTWDKQEAHQHFLAVILQSDSHTLFLWYQGEAVWVSLFPLEFVNAISKEGDPLGVLNFATC